MRTDERPLVEVRFFNREGAETSGALVAEFAGMLGIGPEGRAQLHALTVELVHAIMLDSFSDHEQVDLVLRVERTADEMVLLLEHHGAPTSFTAGRLPPRIDSLVALGFADEFEVSSLGMQGNRAVVRRSLPVRSLTDDTDFTEATSADPPPTDVGDDEITVRLMTTDDVVGVARLYFRAYGYTKIGTPYIYDPEMFAQMLQTGRHLAAVAVAPNGRIVGHLAMSRDSGDATVGYGGPMAVEPAFRGRGLMGRMAMPLGQAMIDNGMTGYYGEAVTVHPASQKLALQGGAKVTAVILARQPGDVEMEGFEASDKRRALVLVFHALNVPAPQQVHVPRAYSEMVAKIYEQGGFDRPMPEPSARQPEGLPQETVFNMEFSSGVKTARVAVAEYGQDFLPALQQLFRRLDADGYELDLLELPLTDPATAYFGAGLGELGVYFNGVRTADDGDVLVLGRCIADVDIDGIEVYGDFTAELRDYVVADYKRVSQGSDARARSRAAMARIYEAM